MITGVSGKIGYVLAPLLKRRYVISGIVHNRRLTDPDIRTFQGSLADEAFLEKVIDLAQPDFLLHLGAVSLIPLCRDNPSLAYRINVFATAALARLCSRRGIRMLFASSDMVYDGRGKNYSEDDPPSPLSLYGKTKMEAEEQVRREGKDFLIFRLALNYGHCPADRPSFFYQVYQSLLKGKPVELFEDEIRNMLYTPDLAPLIIEGLEKGVKGLYHIGGPEAVSRFAFGRELCRQMGCHESMVTPARMLADSRFTNRPADLSFDIRKMRTTFPDVVLRTPAEGIADFLKNVTTSPS